MGPVSSMWKAKPQPITLGAVQTQRDCSRYKEHVHRAYKEEIK